MNIWITYRISLVLFFIFIYLKFKIQRISLEGKITNRKSRVYDNIMVFELIIYTETLKWSFSIIISSI